MKILVRGTNWIGDAVMTIPAVRKLRHLFPDAGLTLQTREWAKGILDESGLFDEIITPTGFFDQVVEIRKRRFDLAIVLPNSVGALAMRANAGHYFSRTPSRSRSGKTRVTKSITTSS
jgi:heptosyltransferase II